MEPTHTEEYTSSSARQQSPLSLRYLSITSKAEIQQDDDYPTPRPLRIIKHRSPRILTPIRFLRSPSRHRSPSWKAIDFGPLPIPRRRSSAAFSRLSNISDEIDSFTPLTDQKVGDSSSFSFFSLEASPCVAPYPGRKGLKVKKKRTHNNSSIIIEPVRDINDFYTQSSLPSSTASGESRQYSHGSKASSTYTTPPSRIASDNEATPKPTTRVVPAAEVFECLNAENSHIPAAIPPVANSRSLLILPSDKPRVITQAGASTNEYGDLSGMQNRGDKIKKITEEAIQPDERRDATLHPSAKMGTVYRILGGLNMFGRSNSLMEVRSGNVQLQRAASVPQTPQRTGTTQYNFDTDMLSAKSRSSTLTSQKTTLRHTEVPGSANGLPPESPSFILSSRTELDSRAFSDSPHTGRVALNVPQTVPVLQVKLTLTPEYESVDYETGQSLWVSIEVAGELQLPSMRQDEYSKVETGLDIVLLVHLSTDPSTETLVGSRDICTCLASLLFTSWDRLAILTSSTTTTMSDKEDDFQVIYPLQPVNFGNVVKAVDRIKGLDAQASHPSGDVASALKAALRQLHHSKGQGLGRPVSKVFGHIFLISDIPPGEMQLPDGYEAIQLHTVNPSVVPWPPGGAGNDGWQLDSLFIERPSSTVPYPEDGVLLRRLKTVIEHARLGSNCGRLQDLDIYLKVAPRCKVEAFVGETTHLSLGPGQRILLFLKLGMLAESKVQPTPITSSLAEEDMQSPVHLWNQLDAMLGQSKTEILTVEVKWRHSLLSKETILSRRAAASLSWHTQRSSWGLNSTRQHNKNSGNQIHVQKNLGHFTASNYPHRQAISALRDIFRQSGILPSCLPYFRRLKKELRYRARRDNRRPIPLYINSPVNTSPSQGHRRESRSGMSIQTTKAQDQECPILDRSVVRVPSEESFDEAARIWAKMREKTRVRANRVHFPHDPPAGTAKKAVRNRRNFRPDT